jgi:hypothetical protein
MLAVEAITMARGTGSKIPGLKRKPKGEGGRLRMLAPLHSTWSFYWSCWHVGAVAVGAGHSYLV